MDVQSPIGGYGSARQSAAARELILFFSNLSDHVHRSWAEFDHPDLTSIALNDMVARRQISRAVSLRACVPQFEGVSVSEEALWCMDQSVALHGYAARLGAHALGRWIQRRVTRSEVALIEDSLGKSMLEEIMYAPIDVVVSGDVSEIAAQITDSEKLRELIAAIGWDCMIDLSRSALGAEHAAAWRVLLIAPMTCSTCAKTWQVSYRHTAAMRALNAWSVEGVFK